MDLSTVDFLSMLLVGALWGCTNPLLRKGSSDAEESSSAKRPDASDDGSSGDSSSSFLVSSLRSFANVGVWLPYVLNQSGSIVFYVLLANSDISMAVPICNAMALLFSFLTSSLLGEPIQKPLRTGAGAFLIMVGVAICVSSQEHD